VCEGPFFLEIVGVENKLRFDMGNFPQKNNVFHILIEGFPQKIPGKD
jgi:hypothetical protein